MNTLFGVKDKMTQDYVEGNRTPITSVKIDPCVVVSIKTKDRDGYWAIQIGIGEKKLKNTTKPLQGHFDKTQKTKESKIQTYPRYFKEIRLKNEPQFKIGDTVSLGDIFQVNDLISVSAITKGKGFAGGVRRFNFKGGPKTHGQSDRHRAPGSVGQTTTPGRVYKGKRMAGRMGSDLKTIKNLKVVKIDSDKNYLFLSGPIPGRIGAFVTINKLEGENKS